MKPKTPSTSPLKSHIGFWMRLVSNNVSQSFARKLEQCEVTVAEWVVLREMFEHGDRTQPGHVAELTHLSKGAISKLIDRLLDKKLVTRRTVAQDRRYQEIELTPKAKTLVPKLARLADENDEHFFKCLSPSEKKSLMTTLQKIAEAHEIQKVPTE